ncbi:hypothetical protein PILCRDRAFT_8388 [Piloderma croceum F 1598]|uniref:CCHC-type domain-containing protein n=1 Tax=Piloderma croceum (strain F 1598) TaxID=765440 RepID=A0A0C3FPR1_PILCF|nr:hypothetical protein PILCRDRAFT_8388 [Piloderma croceum F 1598]
MAVYTPGLSNKPKGGNLSRAHKPPVCWNCGETGHIHPKCPKPRKDKKSNDADSAHVTQESDDDAFSVSDDDSMPDLKSVSNSSDFSSVCSHEDVEDSDDGDDWFSVVDEDLDSPWGDGWETEELSGIEDEDNSFFNVDLDSDSAAYVGTDDSHVTVPRTELYDSGTTRHLSPYHEMFNNFTEIPLRTFNATNNYWARRHGYRGAKWY